MITDLGFALDIQVMHSLHSSTSSAGIAATANDLLDVIHPPHHSITAPNLTKSAANLQSHVSNVFIGNIFPPFLALLGRNSVGQGSVGLQVGSVVAPMEQVF